MKKTKILATFGPSIASKGKIRELVKEGVNIFRINCSHGNKDDFIDAVNLIRNSLVGYHEFPIGILIDISGPKLRLDRFEGELKIKQNATLTITDGKTDLSKNMIGVNHPGIIKSVKKNERLFIDDGNLVFKIISTDKKKIVVKAMNAGVVLGGKGINLPDTTLDIPTLNDKDKDDIKTAVEVNADYIAISFVRSGNDIIEAKKLIKKFGGKEKVIAKLEKRESIELLEEIMLISDGVMVARGDLGVEMPPELVPKLQKKIIKLANRHQKPVIVATQMLESMRVSPRATRAEISDVATAVFDYVDAVMLSAETATGDFPVEAVKTMTRVIETTELSITKPIVSIKRHLIKNDISQAIGEAVSMADEQLETKAIFAFTTSGFTGEMMSNMYPRQPIIALSPDESVLSRLSLYRGVYAALIEQPGSFDDMIATVTRICKKFKLAKKNDKVFITGGAPFGSTVPTNFMMIYELEK